MKELSIEEKAKAYDEAIERAKKWRYAPNIDKMPTYGNRIIEDIFSELKESEGKRIRKAILSGLNYLETELGWDAVGDVDILDAISWIEKQGEQKTVNHNLEEKEETIVYQGEVYTRFYRDELDKFACKYPKKVPLPSKKYRKYSETDLTIAVKAGAQWQKQQDQSTIELAAYHAMLAGMEKMREEIKE